jgi:DNA polymerase-3 subunit delta
VKLRAQELTNHLARGLASVYLIAGDEPLLVFEALREIRARAIQVGFEHREQHIVDKSFRWADLEAGMQNLSLFSSRRIVELRLPTARPGDQGSRTVRAIVERSDPDNLLLIATSKLDRAASNSVWVKCIEQHGAVIQVWPIDRPNFPSWIRRRAAVIGLDMSVPASELLAGRVEGNLLAADQELQKLLMLLGKGSVSEDVVLESVASNTRFDVFRLRDAMLAGDAKRTMKVLYGLRTEGVQPALVLWTISRELCLLARLKVAALSGEREAAAMQRNQVWQNHQPLVRSALKRFETKQLIRLITRASEVDGVIKGMLKGDSWNELISLLMETLTSQPQQMSKAPWRAA